MKNYDKDKVKQIAAIIESDKEIARYGGWEKYFKINYKDLYVYILEMFSMYFSEYKFEYSFSTKIKFILEDRIEPIVCKGCHKPIFLNNKISHDWQFYHDYDCRKLDKQSFILDKEKYKAKTGYDHPMHNPETRKRMEEHNLKVYKSKHFFGSEVGKKKLKESYIRNLGVDNPSKLESVTKRISLSERSSHYERLLNDPYVKPLFSFEKYSVIQRDKDILWWECKRCGKVFAAYLSHGIKNVAKSYARCPYCFPVKKFNSTEEFVLANWLSSMVSSKVYHKDTVNRTTINGELDIFIPDLNFAIEYNGIYWHSEKFRKENGSSNRYSIFEKTKQCEDKGIVLFHIYEDEWLNIRVRHKIESIIKKILFDRDSLFKNVSNKDRLILPRDKFSMLLQPPRFKISSIKEPFLEKHGPFDILNAGTITYSKV